MWISFKIAVLVAAILAGLILTYTEAKENPVLTREAQRASWDQDAQRSLNNLVEQIILRKSKS